MEQGGSVSCHTCLVKGPQFMLQLSKDRPDFVVFTTSKVYRGRLFSKIPMGYMVIVYNVQ